MTGDEQTQKRAQTVDKCINTTSSRSRGSSGGGGWKKWVMSCAYVYNLLMLRHMQDYKNTECNSSLTANIQRLPSICCSTSREESTEIFGEIILRDEATEWLPTSVSNDLNV